MTIRHGKNLQIYLNGYDLSGDLNAVNPKMLNECIQYAVFDGSNAYHYLEGLAKDEVNIEGLFDDTTAGQLNTLLGGVTTGYEMMVLFGQAVGDPAAAVNEIKLKKYEAKSVVTDANRLTADFATENYPFDDCKVLQGKAQFTSDAYGTTLNNGTSSSYGAIGYVQVFEVTGGTGVTISIRHSSDNFVSNDTELLTFGSFTGIGTNRVTTTGTVKRYVAVKWAGIGTSATFAVVMKRNTI